MPSFLGTKEMGLKTEWRFGSVDYSQRAESTPGVLYIGVGKAVMPGVIDPRVDTAGGDFCSAIVFQRRELVYNHLLSDWLRRYEEGRITSTTRWTPVLITASDPDFDALAAAFLVMRLLEKGEFPAYAEALVNYAGDVARGSVQLDVNRPESIFAPHMAYLAVQNLRGPDGRLPAPEARLSRGIELLDRIVSHVLMARSELKAGPLRRTSDFLSGSPGSAAWAKDAWFADIRKLLEAEPAKFARDSEHAEKIEQVPLPSDDGADLLPVGAFVASRPMESMFPRYWAMGTGYPLIIHPSGSYRTAPDAPPEKDPVFPRAALLLDPNFTRDGRRPSLRGLGYALETLESECRKARHEGSDDRGGTPRFSGGYCDNDDPWNDGRESGWKVVDPPRSGTWIPYSRIVGLATRQPFWEIPLRSALVALLCIERELKTAKGDRRPLKPTRCLSSALNAFYEESAEDASTALQTPIALPKCISVTSLTRCFPAGTCPPMTIVKILAGPGATLENLVEARSQVIREMGGRVPDYVFARVAPATHFSAPARTGALLCRLADGPVNPAGESSDPGEQVLYSSRTLIIRQQGSKGTESSSDEEFELLTYAAFLNESLTQYSGRADDLALGGDSQAVSTGTEALCRDFSRFRASYFQSDVGSTARGKLLFGQFAAALRFSERCADVKSGLERLEGRMGEQRRRAMERLMRFFLYFAIGALGLQTLLALVQWIGLRVN